MLGTLIAVLYYVAALIFVVGVAARIRTYAKVPAPLIIPTQPAPKTRNGVFWRMFREVVFFESLFKSNKWTWVFAYAFHMSMWLVVARHLRYLTQPVWGWVEIVQPFGTYAAFTMILGLLGLWGRRILVERIRYITNPSDHLMLALIVGIAVSGAMMRFVAHTDIVAVKAFFMGLYTFRIGHFPSDPVLIIHVLLVALLMIIFPISKLLHAPGVFFSPTRNQVDNPREKRHVAPWAEKLGN